MIDHDSSNALGPRLARRVTALRWDDVPDDVRAAAKAHLLDGLGLALASTTRDYGQAVHRAGVRLGTGDEARVLGFGTTLPAASAALVDGTLIHGLDFDDTHIGAIYHATAPALATALTVGEAESADGQAVLLAYVIGLEVGCRLAAAAAGRFHDRGFHPTGIAGTFAAACVAATLRGLSAGTLSNALGLCGSQAAGILELQESWLKRMHPGWAAHAGIVAATLAEAGFRGPATVLEGPAGLYAAHIGAQPSAEDLGLNTLGTRWMTTEIALKPYPCCHFTHAFVDAAVGVLTELGRDRLDPDEIERIECPIAPRLMPLVTEPTERKIAPSTIYDALFSVQFVVACGLTGRPVDLATFYDRPLDEPDLLAVAAKVTCLPDPEADFPAHFPGAVTVHLRDGGVVRRYVADSHGTRQNPLSDDEVLAKFLSTATRAVPEAQARRIAELVDRLDRLDSLSELLDACTAATATGTYVPESLVTQTDYANASDVADELKSYAQNPA
jgi:2-methylcitrate dehydratase PrpD